MSETIKEYRNYDKLEVDHAVREHYRKMRMNQTLDYVQKMHDKYDIPARKKLLEVLGDFIEEHPDPYKQDFIIKSDTCKYKYLSRRYTNNP